LVIDIRGGKFFDDLFISLNYLKEQGYNYEILFLDANDEALIKRFKESRRKHPLAPDGRVLNGIDLERNKLREVKDRADNIIDTTKLSTRELRDKINFLHICLLRCDSHKLAFIPYLFVKNYNTICM
jgi:UPF0042 nucleotide-binding protein